MNMLGIQKDKVACCSECGCMPKAFFGGEMSRACGFADGVWLKSGSFMA